MNNKMFIIIFFIFIFIYFITYNSNCNSCELFNTINCTQCSNKRTCNCKYVFECAVNGRQQRRCIWKKKYFKI